MLICWEEQPAQHTATCDVAVVHHAQCSNWEGEEHAHSKWQGTAIIIAMLQQIQLYHFLIFDLDLFEFNFLQYHLLISCYIFILSLSPTVSPDHLSVCVLLQWYIQLSSRTS